MMSDNLSNIIDYINDNFQFGSKLKNEKVEEILKKNPVSDREIEKVFDELNSLHIEIIYSKELFKAKVDKLVNYIGDNKVLKDEKLNEWFKIQSIYGDMQNKIRHSLNTLGYTIINDKNKNISDDDFQFLDDIDLEDIDSILNNNSFKEEVANLKSVVDKSHNLEYLVDFNSSKEDFEKRRRALDNIVNANKKLVWEIALRYKRFSTVAFDINDMYQSGMIGLMKAAGKFDISSGNQFSTYATWWIKQNITRSIADYSTTIRIPVHMREKIIKYSRSENEFYNKNGRVATSEELANLLDVTVKEVNNFKIYLGIANLTSLDMPIGVEEGSFIHEFIKDETYQSPDEYIEEEAVKSEIKLICEEILTKREYEIIKYRFGKIDGIIHTLEEIGRENNLTRERIRQIEAKAIKKLQNYKVIERLRDFYYD